MVAAVTKKDKKMLEHIVEKRDCNRMKCDDCPMRGFCSPTRWRGGKVFRKAEELLMDKEIEEFLKDG